MVALSQPMHKAGAPFTLCYAIDSDSWEPWYSNGPTPAPQWLRMQPDGRVLASAAGALLAVGLRMC
eukprot:2082409-Amphidinium_carterae.1